jgi:ankyrin repeat protein
MRRFLAVIAVLAAGTSMLMAAELTLLDAAESGDHAAVLRLANAKGANVNATGADGSTAIMYAAANGDLELVRALIKAGANVKLKNQFGTSALTEAAIIGREAAIDPSAGGNPIPVDAAALERIFRAAVDGKLGAVGNAA